MFHTIRLLALGLTTSGLFGASALAQQGSRPQPRPAAQNQPRPQPQVRPQPTPAPKPQPAMNRPAPKPTQPTPKPQPVVNRPAPKPTVGPNSPPPKPAVNQIKPTPRPNATKPTPTPKPNASKPTPRPTRPDVVKKPVDLKRADRADVVKKPVGPTRTGRADVAKANRPNQPKPVNRVGLGLSRSGSPKVTRALSEKTNTDLVGVLDAGVLSPRAEEAAHAVLSGENLTRPQINALKNAMRDDVNLLPEERSAIASALQEDRDRKDKLLQNDSRPEWTPFIVPQPLIPVQPQPLIPVQPEPLFVPTPSPTPLPVRPLFEEPAPQFVETIVTNGNGTVVRNDPVLVTPTPEPEFQGLEITAVTEGGAADAAGLTVGDFILAIAGHEVQTLRELKLALAAATQAEDEFEVIFLNSESGEVESTTMTLIGGKLGAAVTKAK